MAEGDGVADQGIRVRLSGSADESDIDALKSWLEREQPLEALVREGKLVIQVRSDTAGAGERGSPMGLGMEIFLAFVGGASGELLRRVTGTVERAFHAWQENRRDVESGDPPDGRVDAVTPDER
ncbi:hypothetical protein [Streptomyces griseoaurantiacus]|uniref:YbaB/EbfC DNA-binding family protein n=1 Tax=Streptomyces griseoaurantiacus TaxID=68213 RepID=A0ABZ1V2D9_9ACTN|nr:hypothetical protein [Streptomyces jietaisiensis]WTI27924.1 hypothetical protein OHA67_17135 [Streptomyces jietaisiensis]